MGSQKIVINVKHGGFGLSHQAMLRFAVLKGINLEWRVCKGTALDHLELPSDTKDFKDEKALNFIGLQKIFTEKQLDNILDLVNDGMIFTTYYIVGSDNKMVADCYIDREDLELIQVVEELGVKANGRFAKLKIVTIPENIDWEIEEYDGVEEIVEKHRKWS